MSIGKMKILVAVIMGMLPNIAIAENTPSPLEDVSFSQIAEVEIEERLQSVVWQPSGDLLLFSGGNGVYIYDANFMFVAHHTFDDNSFVISSVWNPDSQRVASLMQSGNVIVWQIEDGMVLDTWEVRGIPLVIAWSPDGTKIAVGSDNGYGILTVYDVDAGLEREVLTGNNSENSRGGAFGGITSINWHPTKPWIIFGASPNARAIIWDIEINEQIDRIRTFSQVLVTLNPEGTEMVLAGVQDASSFDDISPQPIMYIWPLESPHPETTITIDNYDDYDFGAFAWQPQGRFLAAYSFDDQIRIWDTMDWQLTIRLPAIRRNRDWPTSIVHNSLAWNPDGTMLVDAGDGMFRAWRYEEN